MQEHSRAPRPARARTAGVTRSGRSEPARAARADVKARAPAALTDYRRKRDFTATREPAPAAPEAAPGPSPRRDQAGLRFVVQKHAARRLHYDFRLEWDGALKSWAVAKGPSLDPQTKRLAVHVEDHPLGYATFEGVIAEGNYGAGQVIVWDTGPYSPDEGGVLNFDDRAEAAARMRDGFERGKLSFTLRGHKLKGSWTLVRTARAPHEWLLIKHRDTHATAEADVLTSDRSVVSGLTLEEIEGGRLPDPASGAAPSVVAELVKAKGRPGPFPEKIAPMLAHTAVKPFSHPDWLFEPKLDGYRIIALVRGGHVRLLSRNGIDYTASFPDIAAALSEQPEEELVLDGEAVVLNTDGVPDFGLLQRFMNVQERAYDPSLAAVHAVYYPFDLLYHGGTDLRRVPLFARKALLARALAASEHVQAVQTVEADGEALLQASQALGLEGIVAKRRDSAYESGARSQAWLKIKTASEQEFVVGGYTRGTGARASTFGALIVGTYQNGTLRFAGRVGTGFDDRTLRQVLEALGLLRAKRSPFTGDVDLAGAEAVWCRPTLVARVRFAQWTDDGRLRAPVFLGLRPDVEPSQVTRQEAVAVPVVSRNGVAVLAPRAAATRAQQASDANGPGPRVPALPGVVEQLNAMRGKGVLVVEGQRIALTNLDKPLWPATADHAPVTKRDLIRYYARMGPWLLPHLRDRPLTLTRYPNGVTGEAFYQKHPDAGTPPFVESVPIFVSHHEGTSPFVMANNLATIVWLAQQAAIELHPWNSRIVPGPDGADLPTTFSGAVEPLDASVLNYPDFIVFDFDPYIYSGKEGTGAEPELNKRAFAKGVEVALALKDVLDQLALSSFVKTSGKTGLHIYVPVLRQYTYDVTRKTCETIGRFLMRGRSNDVTMEWTVGKRAGKIFLDHNQNVRGKNMASIYSPRPVAGAPVSTPVRWDELASIYPTQFTMDTVPERVATLGDLWADILDAKHDLRRLLEAAG